MADARLDYISMYNEQNKHGGTFQFCLAAKTAAGGAGDGDPAESFLGAYVMLLGCRRKGPLEIGE